MNIVHMGKPSVHEHSLFEIVLVVGISYFGICSMPFLRLTSPLMYAILVKLLIREDSELVIGWPVNSLDLVINRLANGPV